MEKNKIGMLRRELGLNQKELGDKLGVGQTTVSAWETGKNEPDYKSIRAMAALFEVSPDYLLGFSDDEERRGLSQAEYEAKQKRTQEKWEAEQTQREIEEQNHQDKLERIGFTEEEMEQIIEDGYYDDWKKSGMPVQFETYKAIQIMEHFNQAERAQALGHIQVIEKFSKSE